MRYLYSTALTAGGHAIPWHFKLERRQMMNLGEKKNRQWWKNNMRHHKWCERQTERRAFSENRGCAVRLEESWCFRLLESLSAWRGMKGEQRGTAPATRARSWQSNDWGRENSLEGRRKAGVNWNEHKHSRLALTDTLIVPFQCQ